jgi:hypothetical protein
MSFSRTLLNRLQKALTSQGAATEFNNTYNVTTKGTAEASKALVLDASKGIATITSATITTLVCSSFGNGGSGVAFTDRVTTTDGVASGTARVVGGLAYSNTAASTTIGGSASETLFDLSYNIPANTLKAGSLIEVRYAGFGVTGIGTDTLAHKLYIGGSAGTALITSAAAQLATNATFTGETEAYVRTAGTTGTVIAFGTYKQSSAEGTMTVKDDYVASATINTQAAQNLVVTATWNTTNANSARLDMLRVKIT